MTENISNPPHKWPIIWAALLAIFVLLQSAVMATNIRLGTPPDEFAHISYVTDAIGHEYFIPDYQNGIIVNSGELNYMGHPPLYYASLAAFSRALGLEPVQDFPYLRVLSATFVAFGFILWLATARNLGLGLFHAVALTVASCAVPMFSYLAGSINNDTLAYFGVALFFAGFSRSRMEPGRIDFTSAFGLTAGIIVTLLSKANASLFLLLFVAIFAAIRFRLIPSVVRDRVFIVSAATVIVVCGAYYGYTWMAFDTPLPKPRSLYSHAPPADPLVLIEYTWKYVGSMWERLPVIVSHASISPFSSAGRYFFYTMIAAPVVGWLLARPRASTRQADRFIVAATDAFMAALLMTVIAHVYYVYNSYLGNSQFAGWQPRYYFFALPLIWVPFFAIRPSLGLNAVVSAVFIVSAFVAFWSSVPFTIAEHRKDLASTAAAPVRASGATVALTQNVTGNIISVNYPAGARIRGHVDQLDISGGVLLVRGWIFGDGASKSAVRVLIFAEDRYLGAAAPGLERPDVEKALSDPRARYSGFKVSITGFPEELHECDVQVAAEVSDGSLALISTREHCER